jgi:hypothetical protein
MMHSAGYRLGMDVNKLKGDVNKLKGKAQAFIKDHEDQIETGVSKAETFAKSKTKNPKHDAHIDKVAGKIRGLIPPDPKAGPQDGESGPAA